MFEDYAKRLINWTKVKFNIQTKSTKRFFKEREIWWTSIGVNVGYEQDGKRDGFERPVLIIKKFNHDIFIGLPLTSRDKSCVGVDNKKYYKPVGISNGYSYVILSQVRLFSSKRLIRKIQTVAHSEFDVVKKGLIDLIK